MKGIRRIRTAVALTGLGLSVQLLAALHWIPLTFLLFVGVGVSSVAVGSALLASTLWRRRSGS